jgi:hypothetical protein
MISGNGIRRWATLAGLAALFGGAASSGLAAEADDVFAGADRFRAQEMSVMRAGDGDVTTTVGASQDFEVTSSGNSFVADAIANGAVSFSGEAMKDFGGVANIVLTTGNGNSVNAAVNLIIVLEQ